MIYIISGLWSSVSDILKVSQIVRKTQIGFSFVLQSTGSATKFLPVIFYRFVTFHFHLHVEADPVSMTC